jgi:hypothetical protein
VGIKVYETINVKEGLALDKNISGVFLMIGII